MKLSHPGDCYGFIYKTTNLVNGKSYIGLCSSKKRFDGYLGSGILLRQAISKYGRDNFSREILEVCKDDASLRKAESHWIGEFDAVNSDEFYNLHEGGRGGAIPKTPGAMIEPVKKMWAGRSPATRSAIGLKGYATRLANGINSNNIAVLNGNHVSQQKMTCCHCNRTLDKANYNRWHDDKCKSK